MSLREHFQEIALKWSQYRELRRVDSSHHIHGLIEEIIPGELRTLLDDHTNLLIKGSTGLGNITAAPWIATFDTRITRSATKGYYLVYLVSIDLERLYLCFGMGATQFNAALSGRRNVHTTMESAAQRMLRIVEPHFPAHLMPRLGFGRVNLFATQREKLHRDYEYGNICHLQYELASLPSDAELIDDYVAFVSFLRHVAEDPVTPEPLTLLQSTIDIRTLTSQPTVKDFEARLPAVKKGGTGGGGQGYSRHAKIVGDKAEQIVLDAERAKLLAAGRADLAAQVVHEEAIGRRPGWDISSFDENGECICIEVKATETSRMTAIEITDNEWKAAGRNGVSESYYLYLVTDALSPTATIERLRNPKAYVDSGQLSIRPCRFLLNLRRQQ